MSDSPEICKCPECRHPLTLEWLKENVADEHVKALWAAMGGRAVRNRAISPEQQAKMQQGRAVAKLQKWCRGHGKLIAQATFERLSVYSLPRQEGDEPLAFFGVPESPTAEQAEKLAAAVQEFIDQVETR